MTGLRARFAGAIRWNVAASVVAQASAFVLNIVFAKLMGRDTFGQFAIIQGTLTLVALLTQVGASAATRFVAEHRSVDSRRAGRVLALLRTATFAASALASLLLLAGASVVASSVLKAPQLTPALAIVAATLVASNMHSYNLGVLAGLESFRAVAWLSAVAGASYLVAGAVGAKLGGLNGALVGQLVSNLVLWALSTVAVRRACRAQGVIVTSDEMWSERSVLSGFVLPGMVSMLISAPALWFASAYLVRLPGGYGQMAFYSVANSMRLGIMLVPTLLYSVGLSLMSNQVGLGDERRYQRVYWVNLMLSVGITLAAALAVVVIAPLLLRMYGKEFHATYSVILVLVMSTLFESAAMAMAQVLWAHAKVWQSVWLIWIPRYASIVAFTVLLAPRHGAIGVAIAYTIGQVVYLASTAILVLRTGLAIPERGVYRAPEQLASV